MGATLLNGSTEVVTDLLSRFMSVLIAYSFSVILPSLCVFVLRQWPAKTTAAPSSELQGGYQAVKLLPGYNFHCCNSISSTYFTG
jgi:hypothetical protein